MLIATLAFTLMQIIIKDLTAINVPQIVFFRSGVTSLLCISFLRSKGIPLIGTNQKYLALRAIFGITSMTLFFITLRTIPLGASISIKYLSPVFAAIFATLFLKEKIKSLQWIFIALAMVGVLLLKGFDSRIDNLSLGLGAVGALFGGLVYVTIGKIGKSEHPLVIINYFMFSAAVLSGLVMIFSWHNPTPIEWVKLLVLGSLGFVGQLNMTRSFQMEDVSNVAPVKYMEIIYSLLIGFFWFGEVYSWLSLAGILMILVGMLLNLLVKAGRLG